MCGRYYIDIDEKELRDICDEVKKNMSNIPEQLTFFKSEGEIFPTNIIPVQTGEDSYEPMKWGFKKYDGKWQIINARSETAQSKSLFKNSMLDRRCLIPASGYYEWQKSGTTKQKYSFFLPGQPVIYMAGCYKIEKGNLLPTFVILTRNASEKFAEIHDRMPIIIPKHNIYSWLHDGPEAMGESVINLRYEKVI